ncbi:MAG: restriction endonuclease subunit M [Candidatus Cryptobacteroides sp.]
MADKGRQKSQIKSRERVSQRGEVFTAEREVNAMLDLVADECIRPDSRFLEPACGDGNFLSAILGRKLSFLVKKYGKSPRDFEKNSILALGSLYGIDIMNDNVLACRERLFSIWDSQYSAVCGKNASSQAREAARFIISRNIICGNALTLMCVDDNGNDTPSPIVFSEWALIDSIHMQRSDYTMAGLLAPEDGLFGRGGGIACEGGTFLKRYVTHYKKVQEDGEQSVSERL